MSKKQPQIPIEGDLIFEKASDFQDIFKFFIIFGVIIFFYFYNIIETGFLQIELTGHIGGIICSIGFIFMSILIIDQLKNGIKNETYEGFYFPDKIILYRISNYVDEIYTQKKSKDKLLEEIIELKDEINKVSNTTTIEYGNDSLELVIMKIRLSNKEKGVIISENLRKPHKFILEFKDVKYFLNEKEGIKVVEEDQNEDSSDSNPFYKELFLGFFFSK